MQMLNQVKAGGKLYDNCSLGFDEACSIKLFHEMDRKIICVKLQDAQL